MGVPTALGEGAGQGNHGWDRLRRGTWRHRLTGALASNRQQNGEREVQHVTTAQDTFCASVVELVASCHQVAVLFYFVFIFCSLLLASVAGSPWYFCPGASDCTVHERIRNRDKYRYGSYMASPQVPVRRTMEWIHGRLSQQRMLGSFFAVLVSSSKYRTWGLGCYRMIPVDGRV